MLLLAVSGLDECYPTVYSTWLCLDPPAESPALTTGCSWRQLLFTLRLAAAAVTGCSAGEGGGYLWLLSSNVRVKVQLCGGQGCGEYRGRRGTGELSAEH